MFQQGLLVPQIAEELEISEQTVRNTLKTAGIDTRRKKTHPKAEEICADYEKDVPVPDILRKYDITHTILYRVLADADIPLRKLVQAETRKVQLDRAVELYVGGAPLWAIKQETGIAQPVLHEELHTRGVPLRRPRMI